MAKHTTSSAEDFMSEPEKKKRQHRATFARDKRAGGYMIRVEGPMANRFEGREVPVTRRDNSESVEKLTNLVWSGDDEETGNPVALYKFEAKKKDENLDIIF